ncbi:putative transposase-associated domain-containing protein [Tanacetum coccineum]
MEASIFTNVIVNGDSPLPKRTVDGVKQTYPPTTVEEMFATVDEVKSQGLDGLDQTYDRLQQAYQGSKGTGIEIWTLECYFSLLSFKLLDVNYVVLRVPRKEQGIKREFSVSRTPQQNGVAERKNRTLIEAARTMLADSKLPTTFWAKSVNIACYVQNRVLVIKPHNKTPYELFLGYSTNSKAFRVFNSRTRIVEENLRVNFSEDTPNIVGSGPNWFFDIDALTKSMNYKPVVAGNQSNGSAGTKACNDAGKARMETVPGKDYILVGKYKSKGHSTAKQKVKYIAITDHYMWVNQSPIGDQAKLILHTRCTKDFACGYARRTMRKLLNILLSAKLDRIFSVFMIDVDARNFMVSIKARLEETKHQRRCKRIFETTQFETFTIGSRERARFSIRRHVVTTMILGQPGLDELGFDVASNILKGSTLKQSTADPDNISKGYTQATSSKVHTAPKCASHSDEIICSFFAQQASMPTTHDDEDLLQIDEDAMEELTFRWRANGRNEKRIVAIEDSNSKPSVESDTMKIIDWTKECDAEQIVQFDKMDLVILYMEQQINEDDTRISSFDSINQRHTKAVPHPQGNPEEDLKDIAIFDSGCSGSMTGMTRTNCRILKSFKGWLCRLLDNDSNGEGISGIRNLQDFMLRFEQVSYVEGASVDDDLVLRRAPRHRYDVYCPGSKEYNSSGGITWFSCKGNKRMICYSYGTLRLGHVKFKNINKLVKGNLIERVEQSENLLELLHNGSVWTLFQVESVNRSQPMHSEESTADKEVSLSSDEQALHDELVTANTPPQSTGNTPIDSDDDIPKDGVFSTNSFDVEEGEAADYNNMDPTIDVTSTPTLRIHKIHPQSQIIGKSTAGIQTRRKLKETSVFEDHAHPKTKVYRVVNGTLWPASSPKSMVYVDDIIFGSTKPSMVKDFKDLMQKEFKMSSMGELTFFLGLQVKQTSAGIFLSQDHVRNRNKGCIAEETIAEETIEFFSEYHKSMETIGILPDKHETDETEEGKPLSVGKSSEVSVELFQKAHLYVIQNTDEIVPYIERHKQVLKTENPGKRIAFLENEHSKSFAKWLRKEVERELAISKESVSETIRWISYGPRAIVLKYDAYNNNGYTFRMKCHDGKVYQNSRVSVEAIDLHISKEVATTRQAFYYGVLQEIWVLDYRFRQIPLFKCDWVNHKSGGVKRDKLGYTLVDLNNLGHKVDPFVLASQELQVFYVKDPVDEKLSSVFKTPPKNYKDTYDEVDEEFITVIHHRNDNISSDSSEDRKGASKVTAPIFYGPSTQGLLDAYGYNTIEEYLSWNYFPSTDNESTDMETTDKRNTTKIAL